MNATSIHAESKFDFIFEFTISQRTDGTPTGHRRDNLATTPLRTHLLTDTPPRKHFLTHTHPRTHPLIATSPRTPDGTPASNKTPTAGTENTNESQQHDHKTRMNTLTRTHCVHECNKHTCRILSSISFSNSQSASAPTGHRRDTDGTPTSNETPTAGTENTNETQKHYHRTHMSTVRRTHCVYECNKHTCRI